MPSSGLAGLWMEPTRRGVNELPPVPAGYKRMPDVRPGHTLYLPEDHPMDPDILLPLYEALLKATAPWRPSEGPRAYFDGDQRYGQPLRGLEYASVAPTSSHYRVVSSSEDVDEALAENESPLWWRGPSEPDFHALKALQERQWAAPGGQPLFGQDQAGRYYRTDGGTASGSSGLEGLMRFLGLER